MAPVTLSATKGLWVAPMNLLWLNAGILRSALNDMRTRVTPGERIIRCAFCDYEVRL